MKRRKLLGLVLFLIFITVYIFSAMLLAIHILPDNRWVEMVFYPIVGVIWIFPAMRIIRMMLPGEDEV